MNEVTKQLAEAAQANGICTPWLNELKTLENKDALVDMYIRGLDFCIAHDYPSNDFIRRHFKGTMETHGVFLDDAIELQNQCKCIALGETTGRVAADGYSVVEVWAKHQSSLNITAKDNAWLYSLSHQTNGTGESEWIHFTGSGYLLRTDAWSYPVLRLKRLGLSKCSAVWLSHLSGVMASVSFIWMPVLNACRVYLLSTGNQKQHEIINH